MAKAENGQSFPLNEGAKEKIKLGAAYMNGIANAFVVSGALTVPIAVASSALDAAFAAPFAGLCFIVSARLHLIAQGVLDELDP